MNEFLKILFNIRSLRAAIRDLQFEQLQEIKEKFDMVVEEQLQRSEAEHVIKLEHEKKLAEFRELLALQGISPADLLTGPMKYDQAKVNPAKRAPRPAKYVYAVDGDKRTWTGQGRMPTQIAQALERGENLNFF